MSTQVSTSYACRLLRAGEFMLDGGSMFGVVPHVVWTRNVACDDKNRIRLNHNCLLLEGGESNGPTRRIVIEVGSGNKLPPKMRQIFSMEDRYIGDALDDEGCDPASVTDVIVSHLHFDHAGGLTRMPRTGEEPTWRGGEDGDGGGGSGEVGVVPTFPNATIHVQRREWQDAIANKSVMTRTYYRDHLDPIEGQLNLVDSPIPFPHGYVPTRDELPHAPVFNRETVVAPGISVFLVPGHTWGQQAVKFTDDRGRTIVFTPDVLPTAAHAGAAYSLAYDVEPYTSAVTKRWFLSEAEANDWVLCLDHEPENPFFRVRSDGKGWFALVPAE